MNYKNLITNAIFSSLFCLSACTFLNNKEQKIVSQEKMADSSSGKEVSTKSFPDIIDDSVIRQHQPDNNISSLQKKDFCYDGWGQGEFIEPKKDTFIKALQLVEDCKKQKFVLSLSSDGEVAVWDFNTGRRRSMFSLPEKFNKAVFSSSGEYIAISQGALVKILPIVAGGSGPYTLERLSSNVVSLAFDPSSRAIMVGSTDSKIYRWEFNPEEPLKGARVQARGLDRYHQHSSVVSALAFHPFGRLFFSADWDGNLNAWLVYGSDAYKGEYDENLFGTRFFAIVPKSKKANRSEVERIEQIKVSANGQFLAVGTQEGGLELWQVRGLEKLATRQAHNGMIYGIAISPSGSKVVTVARDGALRVWEKVKKNERLEAYELTLIKELQYPMVRNLIFATEDIIIAGDLDGLVFAISLK